MAGENQHIRYAPNTLMNRFCEQSHSKAFSSERTDTVRYQKE